MAKRKQNKAGYLIAGFMYLVILASVVLFFITF